jgi:hypothetical protein
MLAACFVLLAQGASNAQINPQLSASPETSTATAASSGESSSTDYLLAEGAALPATPAPAPSAASAGQYDNKSTHGADWKGRVAFEFAAGFDTPVSDSSSYSDDGFDLTVGGGFHLSHGFSALIEYQFLDNGLPTSIATQAGVDGGKIHIWGFSFNPVIDLLPKKNTSVYITGGGGFYRKVTNFQVEEAEEYCSYFYCGIDVEPSTVGHFSSNQGGFNVGGGFSHRLAGPYGDGKMTLFAEARYFDILSPAINNQQPNGLGATTIGADTKLLPITFGLRF